MSDINFDNIKDYAFHAKPCMSESCRDDGMILVVGLPFAECLARDLKATRAEVERLTKERDNWKYKALTNYRNAYKNAGWWNIAEEEEYQAAIAGLYHE